MKTKQELEEALVHLEVALDWVLRKQPSKTAVIKSFQDRIGLLEWVLGKYDEGH